MPSVEAHATESLERTGQTYLEVHEWVDNDEETKAARHDITRLVEHSEHVRGIWGEEAAQEYVRHVHDDIKNRMKHVQEDLAKHVAETLAYFGIR